MDSADMISAERLIVLSRNEDAPTRQEIRMMAMEIREWRARSDPMRIVTPVSVKADIPDVGGPVPEEVSAAVEMTPLPVPIRINCPSCGELHIDVGEFETRPHKNHTCQECGNTWMPALVPTVGVQFLPGTKNTFKIPVPDLKGRVR